MPKSKSPRHGSLQFWPRKRSKRTAARVRSWADVKDCTMLGFAGYKVGMTHLLITDNRKTTKTKGTSISIPVTVIECPPVKVASVRFYKKHGAGITLVGEVFAGNLDKELGKRIKIPKSKKKIEEFKAEELEDITILTYTQPKLTGIGKKKPELLEMGLGGDVTAKIDFAKNFLGKEIHVSDVFKEGQQLDLHGISRGKGFQGPVKRFGVAIRNHKSEKAVRNPGSLGPWKGQTHIMWKVAHAGQMGVHQRTEYNKWLIKIGTKPEEINPKGGFLRYGFVKNQYVLVKGSVLGPSKRLVRLNTGTRISSKIPSDAPNIEHTSLASKQ